MHPHNPLSGLMHPDAAYFIISLCQHQTILLVNGRALPLNGLTKQSAKASA